MRSLIVVFVSLSLVLPAAAQPERDLTIDAATRSKVVDGSLAALDKYYVFPDVAKKIGAQIRKHVAARKYDQLTSARAFAEALTADLQAVSHDKHMRVIFSPEPIPDRKPDGPPPATEVERFRDQMKFWNAGYVKAERLDGNVGYLRLDAFGPPGRAPPRAGGPSALVAATGAARGGGDAAARRDRRAHHRRARKRRRPPSGRRPARQLPVRGGRRAAYQRHLLATGQHDEAVLDCRGSLGQALSEEASLRTHQRKDLLGSRGVRLRRPEPQARHAGRRGHRRRRQSRRTREGASELHGQRAARPRHQPGHQDQLGRHWRQTRRRRTSRQGARHRVPRRAREGQGDDRREEAPGDGPGDRRRDREAAAAAEVEHRRLTGRRLCAPM